MNRGEAILATLGAVLLGTGAAFYLGWAPVLIAWGALVLIDLAWSIVRRLRAAPRWPS